MKSKLLWAFIVLVIGLIASNLLFNHINAWVGVIGYIVTFLGYGYLIYKYLQY